MATNILDKRRKEGWRITLWCEELSVICQISLPQNDSESFIEVAFSDFNTSLEFAKFVCKHDAEDVESAVINITEFPTKPSDIIKRLVEVRQ